MHTTEKEMRKMENQGHVQAQATRVAGISRRQFLQSVAAVVGAAALASCAPATPAPTPEPEVAPTAAQAAEPTVVPTAAPVAEKVTLNFWTPGGATTWCPGMWEGLIKTHKDAHPNIDFADIVCGTGDQAYKEVLLARIAAGNPPEVIVYWDSSPVPLAARGSLEPIDELMPASQNSQASYFPAGLLETCVWQGKTYGLLFVSSSYGMFYNKDLFEAKGVPSARKDFPKTWDEMRALSRKFTEWDGDRLVSMGFLPQPDEYMFPMWGALNGSGGVYDAKNQRYTMDAEGNVAAMEYFVSWLDEEYKGDLKLVLDSGNWSAYANPEKGEPLFQAGKLAMKQDGTYIMGDYWGYPDSAKARNWDFAPYPIGPQGTTSVSGSWPSWVVIPKGCKHLPEAFAWLDFIMYDGAIANVELSGDPPVSTKVPRGFFNKILAENRDEEYAKDLENFFIDQLQVAIPHWNDPVQDIRIDQTARALERIMYKAASPRDALAEAQKACQDELAKLLAS